MKSHFDIFISYRREGGLELADSIYQRLINAGYSAFLDLEQLNSGKFNTKLIGVIEQCQDFILVLPPNALDRCSDEDDWVRQEIECALKNKKNIIPILLRGFEWPPIETLPETLRDLPNFNGITASDHNVFVENIERLKHNFLISKPGITWKRYKKVIWSTVAIAIILFGILFGIHSKNHKQYTLLCNDIAMSIMTEIVKLDNNILAAESVLEDWDNYVKKYDKNDPTYYKSELQKSVNQATKSQLSLNTLELTDEDVSILRKNNIEVEEIKAFSILAESVQTDVNTFLESITMFSNIPINDFIAESPEYSYQTLVISLKMLYYGTLSLYQTLPITNYDKLHQTTPGMALLSDIPLSLTKEDYDALQEGAMQDLERIVMKMGVETNELKEEVELMELKQKQIEKDLEKMYKENYFK